MSARIKAPLRVPYGGMYVITDKANGVEVQATTFESLLDRIREERRANGTPIGLGFVAEIEQLVCETYPDECVDVDPTIPRKRMLTLGDVVNGTKVMFSFMASGNKVVSRSEAEARAQKCLNCPYNTRFAKPCAGICKELRDVVSGIINHQGTQYDKDLYACSICGCFLQAAIWLPLETQCTGVNDNMKQQFSKVTNCWKQCD